jgi:chromosomal replication initiator protein
VTESIDVTSVRRVREPSGGAGFASGELALQTCERCGTTSPPWELRVFGDKSVCRTCYGATIELAGAAIKAIGSGDADRVCSRCRAMRDPSLGSAWCRVVELGDERARICANYVPLNLASASTEVTGGRAAVIDVWRAAAEELRATLGDTNFGNWFGNVEPIELTGTELVLSVPDEYTRDWLERRFQPVVRNALAVGGYPNLIPTYIVETDGNRVPPPDQRNELKAGFNPHYTFEEFIVGSGNRLAHASALACVDRPGMVYNPLVIYGGVGVGKTHLLQAIGQEVIDQGRASVRFATSETFTNELIAAIRDGTTGAFRERYRSVDVLLLDDIQFIAGKEATQEEFFHTFNALHQAGKQIVLTSDRPPGELRILEDRLRSRFAWGLSADMQPPDLETRIAIARSKAAQRGRRVPETVLTTVATRASSNVRELEGALNRLFALADLLGTEPGMEIARTVLGNTGSNGGSCRPDDILQAVAAYFRVRTSDLTGQQRERRISYARQMAMYLLREEAKLSLIEVGNQLGGRNHSTVIYSCDKVAESKGRGRVKQDLQAIKQLIYGSH